MDCDCPFYGVSATAAALRAGPWVILPNPGSNQCALITTAHSPCWMQVEEDRAPEWHDCPRNPEWLPLGGIGDLARWNVHAGYMQKLRTLAP